MTLSATVKPAKPDCRAHQDAVPWDQLKRDRQTHLIVAEAGILAYSHDCWFVVQRWKCLAAPGTSGVADPNQQLLAGNSVHCFRKQG